MFKSNALVLFSGGQDSTVCLAWALRRYKNVSTVGFDYGQRHKIELICRQSVLSQFKSLNTFSETSLGEDIVLDLSVLGQVSETSLTRDVEISVANTGLPSTFVPGRNLIFLTLASAVAWRRGANTLVGGMCETDYSGYPDCRRTTLDAQEQALSLGLDREMAIETPLMHKSKADTFAMAKALGGEELVEVIVEETHTCYLGDRSHRHDWGYGCGTCPACELREKGWKEWTEAGRPVDETALD
ncbi:7-cyano-7-deazaguanine synthase QueC [Ponticaulis profundi]|uniref:7-cyano-7-deazaguanine synthase n=1 Tax=Ponticaulis profundi TaxID=2665222 RepID=A0ABW1S5V8_9PROT